MLTLSCLGVNSLIRLQLAKLPNNRIDDKSPFVQRCAAAQSIVLTSNGFLIFHRMYDFEISWEAAMIQAGIINRDAT